MVMAALLVATIFAPRHSIAVVVLAAALWFPPVLSLLIVAGIVIVASQGVELDPHDEVALLGAIGDELRSGHSLRHSVVLAARRVPGLDLEAAVEGAVAGEPIVRVADMLEASLPSAGRLAAATLQLGAETGGNTAAAMTAASLAVAADIDVRRETAIATATVRASLVVLGVLPVIALAVAAGTGTLNELWQAGTVGVVTAGVGLGLLVIGATVAVLLGRSALR